MGVLNKRILVLVFVAAVALVVLQSYSLSFSSKKTTKISAPASNSMEILGEAKLVLENGEPKTREFAGPVVEGMQIWQALLQAAEAGSLDVRYEVKESRFLLAAVNGKGGSFGQWVFYQNGRRLSEAEVLTATLAPGDVIRVVYER